MKENVVVGGMTVEIDSKDTRTLQQVKQGLGLNTKLYCTPELYYTFYVSEYGGLCGACVISTIPSSNVRKYFDMWIELAKLLNYTVVLFSHNDSDVQYELEKKGCTNFYTFRNRRSTNMVKMYLYEIVFPDNYVEDEDDDFYVEDEEEDDDDV